VPRQARAKIITRRRRPALFFVFAAGAYARTTWRSVVVRFARLLEGGDAIMRRWMRRHPWTTNSVVFILLLAVVVLLLGFAHAYSLDTQTTEKCFTSFAKAQWPKWIGCAMSKHENLAGGLFGFGGALYAAWVTAQGISRQMHMELVKREEDKIEKELPGLSSALEWVNQVRSYLKEASGQLRKIQEIIDKHSRHTLDDTVKLLESDVLTSTPDRWRRAIASDLMQMRNVIPRGLVSPRRLLRQSNGFTVKLVSLCSTR